MRDRMINLLLMILVGLALGIAVSEKAPVKQVVMTPVSASPTQHPIDAYRRYRESAREEDIRALEGLIQAPETDEEIRALGEQKLLDITAKNQLELAVEGALAAYGDGRAVCVAGEDSVTVFLSIPLDEQQAALIYELVQEFSLVSLENIRITGC